MKRFILFNILLLSLILSTNSFYFRYKSNINNFNDNEYKNENDFKQINEDFIVNIVSKKNDIYVGFIVLLNYSINKKNYIKNKFNDNKYSNLINDNKFSDLFNQIIFDDLKETNFQFKKNKLKEKINNSSKNKIYQIANYFILKIKFTSNTILEIYKPEEIEKYDFTLLIQDINKGIFLNKENIEAYFEKSNNQEFFDDNDFYDNNKEEETFENDKKRFSFKNYFEEKIKNKHFNIVLFKRNYLGFGLTGKAYINIKNDKISFVTIKIYLKIKGMKPYSIFTKEKKISTHKFKEFLEYAGTKGDIFSDKIFDYFKLDKSTVVKSKINDCLDFIFSVDYKEFFLNPISYTIKFILTHIKAISNSIANIIKYVIEFIINNKLTNIVKQLFDEVFKILAKSSYYNIISNNVIFVYDLLKNLTSNGYEKLSNSKYGEYINSLGEHIKKESEKYWEKGKEKYKEIESSETVQNIYKTIENVGDKIYSNTKEIKNKIVDKINEKMESEQVKNIYDKIGNIFSKENINNIGNKIKYGADVIRDKSGEFIKKGYDKVKKASESEKSKDILDKIGNIGKKFGNYFSGKNEDNSEKEDCSENKQNNDLFGKFKGLFG